MDLDRAIALLASIGSCGAAATGLTLVRQAAQHREASYRPDLVLLRTPLYCGENPFLATGESSKWFRGDNTYGKSVDSDFVTLPLKNVGLGAARSVQITWKFPLESAVERLSRLAGTLDTNCRLQLNPFALACRSESHFEFAAVLGTNATRKVDYVVAAPTDSAAVSIPVPPEYLVLLAAEVHFAFKSDDASQLGLLPPLTIALSYSDIGGKRHGREHTFNASLLLAAGADSTFSAMFETGYDA